MIGIIIATKEGVTSTGIGGIVQDRGIDMSGDEKGVARGTEKEIRTENVSEKEIEEMAMVVKGMVRGEEIGALQETGRMDEEVIHPSRYTVCTYLTFT